MMSQQPPKLDWVQLGILSAIAVGMIASLAGWCDSHYAKQSDFDILKEEVHSIFLKVVPEGDRTQH